MVPRRACRHDPSDVAIRDKHTLQYSVITAGRAHAEYIPCFLDCVAFGLARHECVNDFWLARVAGVHSMQAKSGPDGRQAAEVFPAREPVAAIDTFRFRSREENRYIIAAFRMAGCEDLAGGCLAQEPFQ